MAGADMNAWIAGTLLMGLVVLGCDPGTNEPKEPVWGKQPCEHCAMVLSDKDHGAQLVTKDDERLFFDDLGCMAAWSLEHEGAAAHEWVHTADTRRIHDNG
jgi:copper chaperone NosL